MPARHLIPHYADKYYINFRKPLALMETARGCPFKCNFCSVWKFHDSTFREKSPERVVAELRAIEAPNVFITDDIFWMDVRRSEELARQIKAAGIKKYFTVQTRTDIICKFPHLIEMWKDCGSLAIFLGLESVTDEGLKSVNKSNTMANNRRALDILKEMGVGYTPNFIVDPAWDHDDFTRLRDWISETGAYNSGFSVLTPLPGTDLWETAKHQVTTHDWEMYDIIHAVLPTRLPLADFYEEYSRLWRHVLEVRYQHRGKVRTYFGLGAALATRKVTLDAVRKGMNMAKVFSAPETFLRAHHDSEARSELAAAS
jgi:hopanoid C-3 methylase